MTRKETEDVMWVLSKIDNPDARVALAKAICQKQIAQFECHARATAGPGGRRLLPLGRSVTVCPSCGCEIEAKPPRRRSTAQNALWWRYMTILGRELGYTAEEMHDAVKLKLLGREDLSTGLTIIGSTKGLDVDEFSKLIDSLRLWAHQSLNIYLPAPDERGEEAA